MNWYLQGLAGATEEALHHLSKEIVILENPGLPIPQEIWEAQKVLTPRYWGYDREKHFGQLVMNETYKGRVLAIFAELFRERYRIQQIVPIAFFGNDDECSMRANNTSGFNYRYIKGAIPPRLSDHCFGAFDLEPWLNPCISGDEVQPEGAVYDPSVLGTITADSFVVRICAKHGYLWGGNWEDPKDYQHFYPEELA